MAKSFFFYDLETSGFDPRYDRIMQFAGQRTDLDLNPINEPFNFLIKLGDDVLPSPDALMVTGISPQQTIDEGISEVESAHKIANEIFTPDTIAVGFNNIRFDDEFIRHLFWRNFLDPYEWAWKDNRSRWDMLDVVRIVRALRPDGINWPIDSEGKPTNRLELLTKENGLKHQNAHDALSDVEALIDVTRLIKQKQPKIFDFMFKMRQKNDVAKVVNLESKQPFVYVSGSLDSSYNKATVAFPLTSGPNSSVVIYDLRHDPTEFLGLSEKQIGRLIFEKRDSASKEKKVIPFKLLHLNKSPAVAPLGVLEQESGWQKIGLSQKIIEGNLKILLMNPSFSENIRSVYENREQFPKSNDVEAQLYDGFIPEPDKIRLDSIRAMSENELADFNPNFVDERLSDLLLRYKARNFRSALTKEEEKTWESWRKKRLIDQFANFYKALDRLYNEELTNQQKYILEETRLYGESIMPSDDEA